MAHPYVRRYWSAAVTGAAVADLLRLVEAARRGTTLKRPLGLPALGRAGLVTVVGGQLWVAPTVPLVPPSLTTHWPPWLRREHRRALDRLL